MKVFDVRAVKLSAPERDEARKAGNNQKTARCCNKARTLDDALVQSLEGLDVQIRRSDA